MHIDIHVRTRIRILSAAKRGTFKRGTLAPVFGRLSPQFADVGWRVLWVRLGVSIWAQMGPIGPKQAQMGPIGHVGRMPKMAPQLRIATCPKCPTGPDWASRALAQNDRFGYFGQVPEMPNWADLGLFGPTRARLGPNGHPKRPLNTRHPTSANCGDDLPETGVKSPRL